MKSFYLKPKFFSVMKNYSAQQLVKDIVAGVIVAIIALPLSIALALASGVVASQGMDGLFIATILAGVMLILMGVFRFGSLIKFIPHTITTGFTSGMKCNIVLCPSRRNDVCVTHKMMLTASGKTMMCPADTNTKPSVLGWVLCVGVILTAPSGAQNHLPYSRLWQRQKAIAPFVLRRRPICDGPHLTDSLPPNKNTTLMGGIFIWKGCTNSMLFEFLGYVFELLHIIYISSAKPTPKLFIIHQRSDFIIHYSLKILWNE